MRSDSWDPASAPALPDPLAQQTPSLPGRRFDQPNDRALHALRNRDRAASDRHYSEGEKCFNADRAATFRFYAELNDFLPAERSQVAFVQTFHGAPAVKGLIESLGVPHTEIDLILVNGETQAFDYRVKDGDRISVFPVFESLDVTSLERLRPRPLREPRFVLDVYLGRLGAYLRMLGFDAVYRANLDDDELASSAEIENRILLTKDRQLSTRKEVSHAYRVREALPRRQAVEVLRRFDLVSLVTPFRRCLACNSVLEPAQATRVTGRVSPGVAKRYIDIAVCPNCRRTYWKGSHQRRMAKLIEVLMKAGASTAAASP